MILLWVMSTIGCTPENGQLTSAPPPVVEFTQPAHSIPAASPETTAAPKPAFAAAVNGQPILLDDFKRELAAFSANDAGQGIDAELQLAVLNRMIDQQIIEQNAQLLGIEVTEAEVNRAKSALAGNTSLNEWLTINGLSAEQFDRTLKQELLAERLFDEQTKNIASTAEQVRLFFLWVDSETLAETVTQRLQQVDDFTVVSQEIQSYHPDNAGGGYADWFATGGSPILPAQVAAQAFSLDEGQIYGPIAADNRQYFIRLEEKDSDRLLPEQELQQLKQASFAQWLAMQKDSADVEIYITTE